jgi:hypothetical protein
MKYNLTGTWKTVPRKLNPGTDHGVYTIYQHGTDVFIHGKYNGDEPQEDFEVSAYGRLEDGDEFDVTWVEIVNPQDPMIDLKNGSCRIKINSDNDTEVINYRNTPYKSFGNWQRI